MKLLLTLSLIFTININTSMGALTPQEQDDYDHLSIGADVFPYDWWIRLKSTRDRDLGGKNGNWDNYIKDFLDRRASMSYDNYKSKYVSGIRGLSVTWSGNGSRNADALNIDPETKKTILGKKAPIRIIGDIPSIRMLGTTCSLCHTRDLKTKDNNYSLPGGPSNLSLDWLLKDMVTSALALLIDYEGELVKFLVSFDYKEDEAKKIAKKFKKRSIGKTNFITKVFLFAKKEKIIKNFPTYALFKEKKHMSNRFKALLRLTLHLDQNAELGEELDARMDFLANLAAGTPNKTYQDGKLKKFKATRSSYGRTDAFNSSFNRVFRHPKDRYDITAPVGFPPVWGIQNKYLIHYTGNTNSVMNRNIGLAVSAGSLIFEDSRSTVKIENLYKIENLLYKFDIPNWKNVFENESDKVYRIDDKKADLGKKVFEQNCMSCHSPVKKYDNFKYPLYEYPRFKHEELGTDIELARTLVKPTKPRDKQDKKYPSKLYLNQTQAVLENFLDQYNISQTLRDKYSFKSERGEQWFIDSNLEFKGSTYIATDLAGIWSTAPFLHNDSVPTLWDLLKKPELRPKVFKVKKRFFDPINVGLLDSQKDLEICQEPETGFLQWDPYQCIKTTDIGSSNSGHDFGTDLSDDEKWALIEYLKIIKPYKTIDGENSTYNEESNQDKIKKDTYKIKESSKYKKEVSEKKESTPFLDKFDKVKLSKVPFAGDWFEEKDLLKHRLLTFLNWSKKNPKQMFSELRSNRPIAFMSKMPIRKFNAPNKGLVVLSKYSDIVEALEHPSVFSARHVGYKLDPVGGHMLGTDNTKFNKVEKPWLRKLITHADYPKVSSLINQIVITNIQKNSQKNKNNTFSFDLEEDFSKKVPGELFQKFFGFSSQSVDSLIKWSHWIQKDTFQNPVNLPATRKRAIKEEYKLLEQLEIHIDKVSSDLEKNKLKPINDTLLERMLLSKEHQSGQISKKRIAINMVGLVGASIDTVSDAFKKSLKFYLNNPKRLSEARELIKKRDYRVLQEHIMEGLRITPLTPVLIRYTEKDYVIAKGTSRETLIPQGTSVLLGIYSAMKDPEYVDLPDEFKLGRSVDTNFIFGYGHHKCAGDHLAKQELAIMMSHVLMLNDLELKEKKKKIILTYKK